MSLEDRRSSLCGLKQAHSRYLSEDAYKGAAQPKELMIISDANHVDLYDRLDKIPFDKMSELK